jgi:hypothetical protein
MLRALCTIVLFISASAYRQDLAKLPNGNSYGLTLGHPGGNTKVPTKLASTFYQAGQTWNKAFCMADADGDGQSNGLEMGDPCCKWSVGQTPQFTTGLSDPNSPASTTLNKMPSCIMANANANANANAKLQCPVCVQALQLELAKVSDNAAEFSLKAVKACKDATQDDAQKLQCVETLLKNADQLVMDQKNAVPPIQSCMNLGLVCMAPPTAAPPTAAPMTAAPTTAAPMTVAPTTVAPKPTPPLPPRLNALAVTGDTQASTEPASNTILIPILAFAGGAACTALVSLAVWRICKKKEEAVLSSEGEFQALPDIEYQQHTA